MKPFIVAHDEKCGNCNWRVSNIYVIAKDEDEAREIYKQNGAGLCAECICEMLMNSNREIIIWEKQIDCVLDCELKDQLSG